MAEKKYIGKPGKQDDPCWKGYQMVGMKKKGGRKVPNCVPEATDIIAKAKEKIAEGNKSDPAVTGYPRKGFPLEGEYGYHPNPGLKPQESDRDEDMDKSYKTANSQLARKPLNAKITEGEDMPWHEDPKNPSRKVGERKDQYGNKIKNVAKHLAKKAMKANEETEHDKCGTPDCCGQCDTAIEESISSMSDARLKYHATKDFPHGRYTSKEIKAEHDRRRKAVPNYHTVKPSLNEEEMEEAYGMWKVDFPKQHVGKKVEAGSVHVKAQNVAHAHKVAAKRVGVDHKVFKSKVTKSTTLPEGVQLDEVLGKDNEWGRPELRKKFAAMTPGQEGLAADKIPTFDPRYDDVTTQYCGGIKEGYLAEISAKGAEARAKFQAKIHKTLNDPAAIKRAKKSLAKKAKIEKEKEPAHLVMQLRKAVSVGSKVHFQDGSHHQIAPNHADMFMHKYNSAKSSIEKEALQKRAHKSHSAFMKAIAEEVETPQGNGPEHDLHMGNGGHIGTVEASPEDMRFGDVDSEELYAELEKDVDNLKWEDIVDLYEPDEIEYEDDDSEEEDCGCGQMSEAITPAGRLKKKFNAMRTKSRRMMARNIAIKRVSTPDRIKARSVRAARRMVYKRLLRNRDISTVSAAEKTRIEAQIKRMAPMVARLSVRVMPQVRKLEQSRIKNSRMRKKK
ncbi:hypothetical protein EBV26_08800 [bacterium]|nr:hypothetical protein [bacterium]